MKKTQQLVKNVKGMLNKIKGLDVKKKIILGTSTAIVSVGVITGIALLHSRSNEITVDDQGNFVASRADVAEASKGNKEVEVSKEKKEYDDKTVKYLDAIIQLKELGVDYGNGETPSEKEIDKALEEVNNKLKEEKDKLDAKHNEEVKEEAKNNSDSNSSDNGSSNSGSSNSGSTNSGSTNSGSSQPSTPSAPSQPSTPSAPPVEEPSTPSAPPVEEPVQPVQPSVPSTPAIASGWKDDIASYVVSYGSTPGRTNVATYVSQDSLDYAYARVNGWFNGDGSTIDGINADAQVQHPIDGKFFLRLYTLKSITVSGCDKDVIAETVLENVNSPGQVDFYWAKVYYDASTNTSTIYFADGVLDV